MDDGCMDRCRYICMNGWMDDIQKGGSGQVCIYRNRHSILPTNLFFLTALSPRSLQPLSSLQSAAALCHHPRPGSRHVPSRLDHHTGPSLLPASGLVSSPPSTLAAEFTALITFPFRVPHTLPMELQVFHCTASVCLSWTIFCSPQRMGPCCSRLPDPRVLVYELLSPHPPFKARGKMLPPLEVSGADPNLTPKLRLKCSSPETFGAYASFHAPSVHPPIPPASFAPQLGQPCLGSGVGSCGQCGGSLMGRKVRPEGGSRAFGGGGNPGLTKAPGWGQPGAPRELA